tara:strand:- start:3887 stop:4936 length:1050 start_codon:yes stop_codon:yes gene_type:complete
MKLKLFFLFILIIAVFSFYPVVGYDGSYICENFSLVSSSGSSYNEEPSVFENYIVWSSDWNILIYDFVNRELSNVTNGFWIKEDADMFENRIVWVEYEPDAQLYSCNLRRNGNLGGCFESDEKVRMTKDFALKMEPAIFENFVFWEQYDGNDFEIFGCNFNNDGQYGGCLENDTKMRITYNLIDDRNVDVFENYVVWESYYDSWDVYSYDISKRKSWLVAGGSGNQRMPMLSKRRGKYYVYYWSNGLGNDDIFYKEISRNASSNDGVVITNETGFDEWNPVVDNFYGEKILWQSSKNGDSLIEGFWSGNYFEINSSSYDGMQQNVDVSGGLVAFELIGDLKEEIWAGYC